MRVPSRGHLTSFQGRNCGPSSCCRTRNKYGAVPEALQGKILGNPKKVQNKESFRCLFGHKAGNFVSVVWSFLLYPYLYPSAPPHCTHSPDSLSPPQPPIDALHLYPGFGSAGNRSDGAGHMCTLPCNHAITFFLIPDLVQSNLPYYITFVHIQCSL